MPKKDENNLNNNPVVSSNLGNKYIGYESDGSDDYIPTIMERHEEEDDNEEDNEEEDE